MCLRYDRVKMDDDHTAAYKGWSIIVTANARQLADASAECFMPSVAIEQQQEPRRRFMGLPRSAAFLNRCDAIQHGIAAAKAFIDTEVDKGGSTRTDALDGCKPATIRPPFA